ncbi:MAG: hypothetical protein LBU37_04710 [Tannerellaceae bacterium]|nr:hypothetical protein [Tannerellaceae bacterium]
MAQGKKELTEEGKAVREIQALSTDKMSPNDITGRHDNNNGTSSFPVPERLREAKEAMGERLTAGSVPKYHTENQSKGFKL